MSQQTQILGKILMALVSLRVDFEKFFRFFLIWHLSCNTAVAQISNKPHFYQVKYGSTTMEIEVSSNVIRSSLIIGQNQSQFTKF